MKITHGILGISFLLFLGAPPAAASTSCSSVLGNLIANCGFETGDFTGWTVSGNDTPGQLNNLYGVEGIDPVNSIAPNNGNFQVFVADLPSNSTTLSQTLTTIAGKVYNVSFYLAQDTAPVAGYSNSLVLTVGNQTVAALSSIPVEGYSFYSFTSDIMLTPNFTVGLTLGNGLGEFLLDDVSVTAAAAPEPSAWMLAPAGLAGLLLLRRRQS